MVAKTRAEKQAIGDPMSSQSDANRSRAAVEVPPEVKPSLGPREAGAVQPTPAAMQRLAAWSGPILIAIAALVMLTWTWGTWPDVLVDFGDQCYIPWRLTEGEVLYRDIAFYNGPLSQYFNALCFRAFGASLHTLVLCNLALLTMLIVLLYCALRQVSRRFAATIACLVFVLLFAFEQFVGIGNYNYVCPYSHEATHGLMLSLLAIVLAWPSERHGSSRAIASGIALGLALLTKAEVFLPGAAATLVAVTFGLVWECQGWGRRTARFGCFLLAFLVPPLLAFLCLASAMPAQQALLGTLGSWVVAVRSDLTSLPFFREGTGMDHPLGNVGKMAAMSGVYALILLPAAGLGLALRRGAKYRVPVAAVVFVVAAVLLWQFRKDISWSNMARPFPLLILLTLVAVAAAFFPQRHDKLARRRFVRQVSLLTFALVMLTKIILNCANPALRIHSGHAGGGGTGGCGLRLDAGVHRSPRRQRLGVRRGRRGYACGGRGGLRSPASQMDRRQDRADRRGRRSIQVG